ncbi:hypothetical protein DPMN_087663 [Dreissena polymorpha]|uniref:PBZ-type domain-containing protein n=1 Tax=Dreissena polymorpha TaxID=45954 RepID=A0A9D4QVT5_DREPO|nr:hypothetical protein DPMN_087663 [Dreissena polymorpha]
MSAISIVKLDDSNTQPITIEEGKTVIGRGAFLQVTDKRVSRNHGVLEVSDGKLYLTPTHTNPCFFKKTPKGSVEIMKKDERRLLENGHIFGLLPDSLYFKVSCPVTENGTTKSKPNRKSEPKEIVEEETSLITNKWNGIVKPEGGLDMTLPLQKKRKLPDWMVQMAKSSPMKNSSKPHARKVSTSQPSTKKAARKKKTESEDDEDFEMEAEEEEEEVVTTTKRGRTVKRKSYAGSDDDDDDDDWEVEEFKPKKRSPAKKATPKAKPKPRARKKAVSSEEEELEEEEEIKPKKERKGAGDITPGTSRANRAAREKRKSYVDDFMDFSDEDVPKESVEKDEDSDFVMSASEEEEEDSGSDWEEEIKSASQKKSKPQGSRRSSRTVGKRKRYADSDEDLESSEDEYVPRSSKKRRAAIPPAKRGRRGARRKRTSSDDEEESSSDDYVAPKRDPKTKRPKKGSVSEEEDEELEEEEEEVTPKKKRGRGKAAKEEESSDEDDVDGDDDDDDKSSGKGRDKVEKVRQLKSKHRPPCMFGKKCYRKNPEHFAEFSHPGDVSYDEQSDLEDDDIPDCPYGSTCYRTNTSHLKQYRHHTNDKEERTPNGVCPADQ